MPNYISTLKLRRLLLFLYNCIQVMLLTTLNEQCLIKNHTPASLHLHALLIADNIAYNKKIITVN